MNARSATLLLLLAAPGIAQNVTAEVTMTVIFKEVSVDRIIEYIVRTTGKSIRSPGAIATKTISLTLADNSAWEALQMVAQKTGMRLRNTRDGFELVEEFEWREALMWQLENTRASKLNLKRGTKLTQVLVYLSEVAQRQIVLDPTLGGELKTGMTFENVTVRRILDLAVEQFDFRWDLRWGVAFVSTAPRLKALAKKGPSLPPAMSGKTVDLDFDDAPLSEVIEKLKMATGLKIGVAAASRTALAGTRITVTAKGLTLSQALALTLAPVGARAYVQNGALAIGKA